MPSEDELFASVDALLEQVAAQDPLPSPDERRRLRQAAGLSQEQFAGALGVRRATITGWEAGRTEPRPPVRAAYARLLEGLAARHPRPAQPSEPEPVAQPVAEPVVEPEPQPEPASAPAPRVEPPTVARARPAPPPPTQDARFANGPLAVLDGTGTAYGAGGLVWDCPATTIPAVVEWALDDVRLGAPRLHRGGRDADPLVVLTAAAAAHLGLPAELADRRGLRLPEEHPVVRRITSSGWQLTRRGFGPWPRVYQPAEGGRRRCVQFAVLPWGALDDRAWPGAADLAPADLAAVLGTYATRVLTPRGSAAVTGLELMTALRPPTRAVRGADGTWGSGPVPGSLAGPVDPAPPEAPDEHPLVLEEFGAGRQRGPHEVLQEEAFDWIRDPQLLTDVECARSHAVGIDVNTAFLAAANRLPVGLGPAVHLDAPAFDKTLPGCWLVDLSGIDLDPRLPNPFTPHGERPDGPAWYATPTVAYAAELVRTYQLPFEIKPLKAWVRPEHGPYLDPWYGRLADAYKQTMADLGVAPGMDDAAYLAAMTALPERDPGARAVLAAIKATVKGGIGKLRERPQGAGWRPGQRWPALERPTWRPDVRAAVIATARTNMHRKILKTALATDPAGPPTGHLHLGQGALLPVAVLSDCAVYLADGPSPLDVLPRTREGKPAPGSFRLGVSPGMVKHEGTQDGLWAAALLDEGHNPARHIKGTDAAADGE